MLTMVKAPDDRERQSDQHSDEQEQILTDQNEQLEQALITGRLLCIHG